jgi:hypothetical protein
MGSVPMAWRARIINRPDRVEHREGVSIAALARHDRGHGGNDVACRLVESVDAVVLEHRAQTSITT